MVGTRVIGVLFGLVSVTGAAARINTQTPEPAPPTARVAYVSPASQQPHSSAAIFEDDFSQPGDPTSRYYEYHKQGTSFQWMPNDGYGGQGGAMKSQFDKGQVAAGSLMVVFGKNPFHAQLRENETFREIYWRVYVKHEAGWEGNPAKLARATCMADSNWSQGFMAHVWGGKGDLLCIDPASGITDSRRLSEKYNDFPHLRWLGLVHGKTPIFSAAESGRWVCVESHIKLNTPGKKDGVFELWVDGKPEAARTELDWHGTWSDYAINAVFLENYWNTGSVKRQSRWLDNFVVSTQPIGPIVATATPTVTRTAGSGVTQWEAQAATDPEGKDVVWTSNPIYGAKLSVTVDAAHGKFTAGKAQLTPGVTHWLRLRERSGAGGWSGWTAWHSSFRILP